jgi:hypothetical protein
MLAVASACHGPPSAASLQPSLQSPAIFVQGVGDTNTDCLRWKDAIWLVHRTATSQILGPNSALHIYRSTDEGKSFTQMSVVLAPPQAADYTPDAGNDETGLDAPSGRDIRDPFLFIVGDMLYMKATTRTPCMAPGGLGCVWDSGINSLTVETHSTDGVNWSPLVPISPPEWGFWRVREHNGTWYATAYHDGDNPVSLFASTDGVTWTEHASVEDNVARHPSEAEIVFLPSGRMMIVTRTDLDDEEGDLPGLQTDLCFADAPYTSFACQPLMGVRLDGPAAFFYEGRLFVVARKHLGESDGKRTALYELTGTLDGGPVGIKEWFEFPSAGDTSYAGTVELKDGNVLVSWYSSDVPTDPPWIVGLISASNIWLGRIQFKAP